MLSIEVAEHPLLELGVLHAVLPAPIAELGSPSSLVALLSLDAEAPIERDEDVRTHVRKLLRFGGYKPSGRGKPASEYLVRAAGDGTLGSINLAVDACNAVSLHSCLPISVVDPKRLVGAASVAIAGEDTSYVFNASGQEILLDGLLCLFDGEGPCANAVKDSQRTKTGPDSREAVSLIWGTTAAEGRVEAALAWYREILGAIDGVELDTRVLHGA